MKTNTPVSRDITHTILAVLVIGLLILSSFWVLRPFLIAIIWAGTGGGRDDGSDAAHGVRSDAACGADHRE
jgi:hypothetical protein